MSVVIVTGVAGYIGGQTALLLKDAGHEVYGIDRRDPPKHLRGICDKFLYQDFASDVALSYIINKQPDAVIHCAGTSLVGPSMQDPAEYYNNNVAKTLRLLDIVRKSLPRCRVIFSSSAAVYGEPIMNPCHEVDPCEPLSPYGESKRMIEQILQSYYKAYGLDYVAFRYFNACGADPEGRHGQEPGATHVIARLLEATRDNGQFRINGDTYPTDDGTCVRDYVHVNDIARAHVLALDSKIKSDVYNLGDGTGTSIRQIIERVQEVVGNLPTIEVGPPRAGDPAVLTASSDKFDRAIGMPWRTYNLTDVIAHTWAWYVRKN
ncbi:UDP-glucose 4-epimerase GalE [Haliscomenobacter sp.]|uniref:UDP-glucose 4-epimerase GalE n=1 Tax=Haliscomenobacter sp. TaxID=2717303 RepID=UPI003364B37B